MNTIPSAMAVAAVAALVVAAGCSSTAAMQPVTPSVKALAEVGSDGVKCPDARGKGGGKIVHVDIVYGNDGPKPDPEECYVDSESTVVWRNPGNKASTFNLVFTNTRMTSSAKVASKKGMDGFKASAKFTGNKDDRFDYTIEVDGQVVDPAVIIK